MTEKIADRQIYIRCRFRIISVQGCVIHAGYGQHTRAEATAVVEWDSAGAALMDTADETVMITGRDIDAAERILFSGVVESLELTREGRYAVLYLKAVSHTWKMDIQKRSRSFQDISMTYREVAETVTREYGASLTWDAPDRHLECPLVQHRETDYQFLTRLLSHLQEGITAGDAGAGISLHAGLYSGEDHGYIALEQYIYSAQPFRGAMPDSRMRTNTVGYRIDGTDHVRVGDRVRIQGMPFYVMDADTVFEKGSLRCSCHVFPAQCFRVSRIPAGTLEGAVLTGRILETRRELVKMHLDIDREQDPQGAYWFPWKPAAGNLLYCMPETGTKAALYFGRADESTGEAIYNIRENGEQCGELADHNNRYFTTDGGKRMYMEPSVMGLLNMAGKNAEIALNDGAVLGVRTTSKMSLLAEGQVELKGKNVSVTTPMEATLVRKDLLSPTVVNLCNAFDSIGQVGSFASNAGQVTEKKRKRTSPGQPAEPYGVEDITRDVLASIPAAGMGSPAVAAVAASMPVFGGNFGTTVHGKGAR